MTTPKKDFRYDVSTFLVSISLLLAGGMISIPAHARDMQGRIGVGYNSQFANATATNGVPGISVKYSFTRDIAIEGIVGVATSTPGNSVIGVKMFKNVFYETSLNFYFLLGGGILSANNQSGVEFLGGMGAEFFIPGLESLGFAIETGGALDNLSGSFVLRTIGVSFLNAGIHFYF